MESVRQGCSAAPSPVCDLIGHVLVTILVHMKTVSVSELKAKLSRYLRDVSRGSEIQVVDRGVPVARLTGIPSTGGDDDEIRQRLARSGVLRLGSGDIKSILRSRPLTVGTSVKRALTEDREDRV